MKNVKITPENLNIPDGYHLLMVFDYKHIHIPNKTDENVMFKFMTNPYFITEYVRPINTCIIGLNRGCGSLLDMSYENWAAVLVKSDTERFITNFDTTNASNYPYGMIIKTGNRNEIANFFHNIYPNEKICAVEKKLKKHETFIGGNNCLITQTFGSRVDVDDYYHVVYPASNCFIQTGRHASIQSGNNCEIKTKETSSIHTKNNSTITAGTRCTISAKNNCEISTRDICCILAKNKCIIKSGPNSQISCGTSCEVESGGGCCIECGNRSIIRASIKTTVFGGKFCNITVGEGSEVRVGGGSRVTFENLFKSHTIVLKNSLYPKEILLKYNDYLKYLT